jgi:hypothetical protein
MNTKTTTRDQVATNVLNYLLQLLSVAAFYFVLLYSIITFWFGLINKINKLYYTDTPNFNQQINYLLIIFSLFCYVANRFMLDLYHREKAKQLIISIIADLLIVPLGIFIMIVYNNLTVKTAHVMDTTVYNIYLITVLVVIKELIASKLLSKKEVPGKKLNSNKR